MNEIELSKRLRTDDVDNLPVIGPGGVLGYWVQSELIFAPADNKQQAEAVTRALLSNYNYIYNRIQTHNPDGIKLHYALLEIERLKATLEDAQRRDWTGSLCDRLNEIARENPGDFRECHDGQSASCLIQQIHGHYNLLKAIKSLIKFPDGSGLQTTAPAMPLQAIGQVSPVSDPIDRNSPAT